MDGRVLCGPAHHSSPPVVRGLCGLGVGLARDRNQALVFAEEPRSIQEAQTRGPKAHVKSSPSA